MSFSFKVSLILIITLFLTSLNRVELWAKDKTPESAGKSEHDKEKKEEKEKEKEDEKEKKDKEEPRKPDSNKPQKEKTSKSRLKIFKESSKEKDKATKKDKKDKEQWDLSRQKRESPIPDYYPPWQKYEEDDENNNWFIFDFIFDLVFADDLNYLKYPYYHNDSMYWQYAERSTVRSASTFQGYYLRINNNLWAYHLNNEFRFPSGTTFELSYTKYIEDVSNQEKNERMSWFKGYFNGYCLENSNWNIKLGIGGVNLSSVGGGLGFQGAIDVFPGKPVGIHGGIGYAFLTSGVDITDYELKLGWFNKRREFTLGYRSLVNSQDEDLSGPIVGFAWWF